MPLLNGANLAGANLKGANLSGLYLENVDMRGIIVDRSTIFAERQLGIFAKDMTFGKGTDLTGTDFSEADLRHVNFYGTKMHEVKFSSKTNFYRTSFHEADCREAKFEGADLRESNGLSQCDWTDSTFINCNLQKQNLYNANLARVDFSGSNLEEAQLDYANLIGANLSNVLSLQGANLYSASLEPHIVADEEYETLVTEEGKWIKNPVKQSESAQFPPTQLPLNLTNVNLGRTSLNGRNLSNSTLKGASFSEADLRDAILNPRADLTAVNFHSAKGMSNRDYSRMKICGADFSGVDLSDSNFGSSNLQGANFGSSKNQQTNLAGVDLSRVQNLDTANFAGVDLSKVTLPEGFEFSEQNYLRSILEKRPDTWDAYYLDNYLSTYSPEIAIAVSQGVNLDKQYIKQLLEIIEQANYIRDIRKIDVANIDQETRQKIGESIKQKNLELVPIKQIAIAVLLEQFPEEVLATRKITIDLLQKR